MPTQPILARGVVAGLLVLAGGLVTAVLPPTTPLLLDGPLRWARDSGPVRGVAFAVVLVGLVLLLRAWWGLRAAVRGLPPLEGTALVRQAALLWSLPLLLAPPLFSRDGWSYAAQGVMTGLGISPYRYGPWVLSGPISQGVDPLWRYTPAPYGPLPLGFGGLAGGITRDPWLLVIAHRGLALVGLVLLAWAVPRLARWAGVHPASASALVLTGPLVLATGVASLHNDLLMVGLAATALVLAAERGWASGAVVAGLAAAVKVPGGLVGVGIVLVTLPAAASAAARLRRACQVAGVALGVVVALGLAAGVGVGWVRALGVPGTVDTAMSATTDLGVLVGHVGDLLGLDLGRAPVAWLHHAGTAGAAVVLLLLGLRAPTGDRVAAVAATAAAFGALVLLGPAVHPWYLLWPLPFLAALRLPAAARGWLVGVVAAGGVLTALESSPLTWVYNLACPVVLLAGAVALGRAVARGTVPAPAEVLRRAGRVDEPLLR